jgi:ribosomal protein L16 Arg81 hydroxylase
MAIDIQNVFPQLVGGDERRFFREFWRKRTLHSEAVLPLFSNPYDCERFLADYRRVDFHEATLLAAIDDQGRRRMLRPNNGKLVEEALARGWSVVLQGLLLPEGLPEMPQQWRWLLDFHNALCEYLLPGLPSRVQPGGPVAALDIFCTFAETSIGGHYDTGDVFYFVLEGEKEWTVELVPDVEQGHRLTAEGTNYTRDRVPLREHVKKSIRPGDCLYVPPYTYHRVRSLGRTLAVSFGLPTFTEVTLLRVELNRLEKERMLYHPLPSFPRAEQALSCDAEREVRRRTQSLLDLLTPAAQ